MFSKGMVVQFIEKHKWAGCLGIITEVKESYNGADVRYMIAVPIPQQGTFLNGIRRRVRQDSLN